MRVRPTNVAISRYAQFFDRGCPISVALSITIVPLAAISFSGSPRKITRAGRHRNTDAAETGPKLRKASLPAATWARKSAPSATRRSRTNTHARTWAAQCPKSRTSLLEKIPTSASVVDDRLHRHFDVHVEDGKLFQSEYEKGADGKEAFRETHEVDWIIGSGANGFGALLKRGDFIFEAPLSFYSKTQSWALSPGYEFGDYGFNRPILPGCIACHSGQPQSGPGRKRTVSSIRHSMNWRSAAKIATAPEQRTSTKCREGDSSDGQNARRIPS